MQVIVFISRSVPEPVASSGASFPLSFFGLVSSSEVATLLLVSLTFLSTIFFPRL
uniref:Uncharacterized protein n=1 Tax=Arundo donax TaxID=35708 RepID=A0A0A9B8W9_ARUDO